MTTYTFSQLQDLWKQAGGNAAVAVMAAAIAMAESGGRSDATHTNSNGTVDRGLWQINSIHGAQSTLDPMANARAAVSISSNGTNWRPWCTAWSDGACGGTFMGTGSPYQKYMDGAQQGLAPIGGTPVENAGLGDFASPDRWVKAFMRPLAVWGLYGALSVLGTILIVLALVFFVAGSWPVQKAYKTAKSTAENFIGAKVKGGMGKSKTKKSPKTEKSQSDDSTTEETQSDDSKESQSDDSGSDSE